MSSSNIASTIKLREEGKQENRKTGKLRVGKQENICNSSVEEGETTEHMFFFIPCSSNRMEICFNSIGWTRRPQT